MKKSAIAFIGGFAMIVALLCAGCDLLQGNSNDGSDDESKQQSSPGDSPYPSTPVNIRAVSDLEGNIVVSWDEVAGVVDVYSVWRSTSSEGGYNHVGNSVTPSYTESVRAYSGLTYDTTYWYKVVAFRDGLSSVMSDAVSATTPVEPVSNYFDITLNLEDVALSYQLSNINQGESANFHIMVDYAQYQWYLDGILIDGATDASYTLNTDSMEKRIYELAVIVSTDTGVKLSGRCFVRVQ
jgi:hypothetical protein